jgi:hypothetical protein
MLAVRLSQAAADTGDRVPCLDEHGSEIAADMTGSADDDDTHATTLPFIFAP